jgi:hypothetical protein
MVVSPGDVVDERKIACNVVLDWNTINSEKNGIILNPIGWDINLYPEMGEHPQNIINRQLLEKADILICIFWTRIGTPTKENPSGSVEEITRHINEGKQVLLYFSSIAINPAIIDNEQYKKLLAYKDSVKAMSYYKEYDNHATFKRILTNDIHLLVNDKLEGFHSDKYASKVNEQYSASKQDAIALVSQIPIFRKNIKLLDEYITNLGSYKSLKLKSFLDEANLLLINQNSDGTIRLSIRLGFHRFSDKDINYLVDDIKGGNYDYCL